MGRGVHPLGLGGKCGLFAGEGGESLAAATSPGTRSTGEVLINLPKPRTLVGRSRPPREEVEPVALELIRRYGADIMATARRYSANREDAEDAYQRGLEILLTKAPSTSADVLVPWLKTVVKHEAYSLHRARERAGQATGPELLAGAASAAGAGVATGGGGPHEQAERLERLQIGAEAL